MAAPKIAIDYQRCTVPFDCKKCLQACPEGVFWVVPAKNVKFQETDAKEPGAWRLFARYRALCTACNKCLEVCPVDALTITSPTPVKKKA
ncbi:MAG: 4Fe-4S binding protein [Chloroflexi bacterium]|nr:4Fe-4S binding protein [Chloroflexota bacterium]